MRIREIIDLGDLNEPIGGDRDELILDLILALVDKHDLTVAGLTEMAAQLIMQHGLRDAAKYV